MNVIIISRMNLWIQTLAQNYWYNSFCRADSATRALSFAGQGKRNWTLNYMCLKCWGSFSSWFWIDLQVQAIGLENYSTRGSLGLNLEINSKQVSRSQLIETVKLHYFRRMNKRSNSFYNNFKCHSPYLQPQRAWSQVVCGARPQAMRQVLGRIIQLTWEAITKHILGTKSILRL